MISYIKIDKNQALVEVRNHILDIYNIMELSPSQDEMENLLHLEVQWSQLYN